MSTEFSLNGLSKSDLEWGKDMLIKCVSSAVTHNDLSANLIDDVFDFMDELIKGYVNIHADDN